MAEKKMLCLYVFENLLDDREDEFSYEYMNLLLQTGTFIPQKHMIYVTTDNRVSWTYHPIIFDS